MVEPRVVLITGAARGLGKAIAARLASDGWHVVASDRDESAVKSTASEIRDAGGACEARAIDVTSSESCRSGIDWVTSEFGGIYGLVNNAGIARATPFLEMTEHDWDSVQNVNSRGVFLMCRFVAPHLVEQQSGSIVNMSSIGGKDGFPNWSHYAASKHAVIGLTRALARELGPSGVRVNAVCPGAIKTDMWSPETQQTNDPDKFFAELAERSALRRGQTPEDIAAAVAFLIGDQAANITAQSISVDSGLLVS